MTIAITETTIRVAGLLYERRRLARELFGPKYVAEVQDASRFIRSYMADFSMELMPAVLEILKNIKNDYSHAGAMAALMIAAAAVEMTEGKA